MPEVLVYTLEKCFNKEIGFTSSLMIDIFLSMWRKILNFDGSIPDLLKKQKEFNYHKKGVYNLDSILWATMKIKKTGRRVL